MEEKPNEKMESEETEKTAKWWHINRKLILLKGHYLFFYGSLAAIIPPLILYSQQIGLSLSMVGVLFAVLPFIQCVAKAVGGSIADKFQIHKTVFVLSIVAMAISIFSMNFIPKVPESQLMAPQNNRTIESNLAHVACDSSSKNVKLKICNDHSNKLYENQTDDALRWPLLVISATCHLSCDLSTDRAIPTMKLLFCNDASAPSHCTILDDINGNRSFFNIKKMPSANLTSELKMASMMSDAGPNTGHCKWYEIRTLTLLNSNMLAENITVSGCPLHSLESSFSLPCFAKCNLTDENFDGITSASQTDGHQSYSSDDQATVSHTVQVTWLWLGCIVAWSAFGVALSIADAILVSTLGKNQGDFGKTRLFASAGWGMFSPITACLIEYFSRGSTFKDYSIGFYMFLALVLCNIAIAVPMKVSISEVKPQKLAKEVLTTFKRPSVLMFILAVFCIGVATGVLWVFGIVYANELDNNPVIVGTTYAIECFISEIPLFWVSGRIVGKLGHATALSCSLLFTGIKSILYSLINDAWYMLPIGLLHGPTYALLYATMATYANMVAPPGASATMQGIFQGVFEGVGVGVGNFLGGIAYERYGGRLTFRIFGCWITGMAILYQLVTCVCSRHKSKKQTLSTNITNIPKSSENSNHDQCV